MKRQRGAALAEFALVWPLLLLCALGSIELAVWSVEAAGARSAALAGARAGAAAGAGADTAQMVALTTLRAVVVGTSVTAACPSGGWTGHGAWVCATDVGSAVEVRVGGSVPALVPLLPVRGLPLHADARVPKEVFT